MPLAPAPQPLERKQARRRCSCCRHQSTGNQPDPKGLGLLFAADRIRGGVDGPSQEGKKAPPLRPCPLRHRAGEESAASSLEGGGHAPRERKEVPRWPRCKYRNYLRFKTMHQTKLCIETMQNYIGTMTKSMHINHAKPHFQTMYKKKHEYV
jgi:hypothetical protein